MLEHLRGSAISKLERESASVSEFAERFYQLLHTQLRSSEGELDVYKSK